MAKFIVKLTPMTLLGIVVQEDNLHDYLKEIKELENIGYSYVASGTPNDANKEMTFLIKHNFLIQGQI